MLLLVMQPIRFEISKETSMMVAAPARLASYITFTDERRRFDSSFDLTPAAVEGIGEQPVAVKSHDRKRG
jgi:hypothetical protein